MQRTWACLYLLGAALVANATWTQFDSDLTENAQTRIAVSPPETNGNVLASAIYQDVLHFWEERRALLAASSRHGHFLKFGVFVWDPDVPPSYQEWVRVGEGPKERPIDSVSGYRLIARGMLTIRRGMVPLLHCVLPHTLVNWDLSLQKLGYPCHLGGSVAVRGRAQGGAPKNCIIFYNHQHSNSISRNRLNQRKSLLIAAMTLCETEQQRQVHSGASSYIDLTHLATCVYAAYPDEVHKLISGPGTVNTQLAKLRGLAVIAVDFTQQGAYEEPGFGFTDPLGGVLILKRQPLDVNLPPLELRYILMYSNSGP